MSISEQEIRKQSLNTYKQWAPQWREQASFHGKRFAMHDMEELFYSGVGKAALLIGNGYSFEQKIDIIKRNQENVDIIACDKTVGHCIREGIIPKYCILCDANVSYEKYLEPYKDKLKDTILIANVCAATKWASLGNWKKIYFFINRDCLKSEKEFQELSGCPNTVVAGTNVSNAMVILMTQCDDEGKRNLFGYDKLLLIGFDYSWKDHYYAFDHDGGGKEHYMKTVYGRNLAGQNVYSSNNLVFSAKWLEKYIKVFKLNVFQCGEISIFSAKRLTKDLEEQMNYQYRVEDSEFLRQTDKMRIELEGKLKRAKETIVNIFKDHEMKVLGSVT